jgi:hypothetical protein
MRLHTAMWPTCRRRPALLLVLVLLALCRPAAAERVAPRVLHPAPLSYPADGGGRTAVVRVEILLSETGDVKEAHVLSVEPPDVPPSFAAAALHHARDLHFSPATEDGVPMAARVVLTLRIAPPPPPPRPAAEPPPAPPPAAPQVQPAPAAAYAARVRGQLRQAERATSDFNLEIENLRLVPRRNAAELLTLAPGILLTNEGGEGHAQRIFLRGFDAREGQDLEITVAGVPVNETANAHGQGYADTHFIIPEIISSLRVLEGPFDPRQGDFAVAGSAEYRLGVADRGLRLAYRGGSFNTHRVLLLWAPDERLSPALARPGTFGAVELFHTDGYGENRFAERVSATAQYEGRFGEHGRFTLLGMAYASRFQSPGVVRQDDYEAGRIGFFGTYDRRQGGDAQRHTLSGNIEWRGGAVELFQQAFFVLRDLRLRENFTGFLLDPQRPNQSPRGADPQRGDLIDQASQELTFGGRGGARLLATIRGLRQQIELGYYARYDRNAATQRRLMRQDGQDTIIPYLTDFDFTAAVTNLAAYLDAEVRPLRFLTLKGGLRVDFFHFNVLNQCAQKDVSERGAPLDAECYSQDRYGYRSPSERHSTTGLNFQPRVTLQLHPVAGLIVSGSYGHGARSADPLFLAEGEDAPFASIRAAEGGALYERALGPLQLQARAAFFYTHVDKDLIFSQTLGRNTLAPGTTRLGVIGAGRLTGPWLDAALHVTWARATFDDTGLLVPYVPDLVVRADAAGFGPLPRVRLWRQPLIVSGGLGLTYVAPRPLPLSERGDAYVVVDLAARARWHFIEAGITIENLLDRRYRLNEFNYVSDFRQGRAYPTLVAARHFIAGPPLTVMGNLTIHLDGLFGLLRRAR